MGIRPKTSTSDSTTIRAPLLPTVGITAFGTHFERKALNLPCIMMDGDHSTANELVIMSVHDYQRFLFFSLMLTIEPTMISNFKTDSLISL